MATGDHLVISYVGYTHHGIDIGDGTVVHLCKTGEIRQVRFEEFCDGRVVWIREYDQVYSATLVIARALEGVGNSQYCLISANCEHFATWCKTGVWNSAQVRFVQRQLIAAVAKGATKATVKAVAKGNSKLAAKAVARAATPWLFVADAAQLLTEVAVANSGADPKKAEIVGRGVGLAGSVGIGAAVAGLPGAGVALGLWLLGEAFGAIFTK